jgi:hypothetical protein
MLTPCTNVEINGLNYKIKPLKTGPAREALAIVQSMLGALEITDGFENIVAVAQTSGVLPSNRLDKLIELFGPTTTVEVPEDDENRPPRELLLGKPAHQDELFTGQIEFQYEWLDACIKYNFERVLGKTRAAFEGAAKRMEAQLAEAKSKSQTSTGSSGASSAENA